MKGVEKTGQVYLMGGDTYADIPLEKTQGILDLTWSNGFKNDVWRMKGTEWQVGGDYSLRDDLYGRKIPKVKSLMDWVLVKSGTYPPPGMTYEDWIICEPFFSGSKYAARQRARGCDTFEGSVQWSPRRHHASVFFDGALWVFGGRAREFVELPEDQSVGGIIGPRINDVEGLVLNAHLLSTKREAIVVKNDVWKSVDGRNWELVTPGCHANQKELVAQGNTRDGKFGTFDKQCTAGNQAGADNPACFGAEECDSEKSTCVCSMWSPREQHQVAAYGSKMYLSGGYASTLYSQQSNCGPYACGDKDASSYRYFLNDIWESSNGQVWTLLTATAQFAGRGGHSMFVMDFRGIQGGTVPLDYLWIIGGRGGNNDGLDEPTYFNDIWYSRLGEGISPSSWIQYTDVDIPWSPRTGHAVTQILAAPGNRFGKIVYLTGGYNPQEGILEDTWSWRPELTTGNGDNTLFVSSDIWRQDFTPQALFGSGADSNFVIQENSPAVDYISADSPISMMQKFWVPDRLKHDPLGLPLTKRSYVTDHDLEMFTAAGVSTIRDLALADKYVILKLRGWDIPDVPMDQRMDMQDVCDKRALAIAIVAKCEAAPAAERYAGEPMSPAKAVPIFNGPYPQYAPPAWYGADWSFMQPPMTDDVVVVDTWDGCQVLPMFDMEGHNSPNVIGLGNVDQVASIKDPHLDLQEFVCRQTPGKRAWHTALSFEERLYVFGGKSADNEFHGDSWYRDAVMPVARMLDKPKSNTPQAWFRFSSNKPGCVFEMRVWDPLQYHEIRPWRSVANRQYVGFLQWQMGGPGNGLYRVYSRAVDAAGNKDFLYIPGTNVHTWYYISPIPWPIIGACIGSFLGAALIAWLEYRRRMKKAAMERYAMKRMRRKFKAMQRELDGRGVDWRTLYNESKNSEGRALEKKKKKKTRDGKADARDAEKKKRDKEKEKIKKKLKASRDFKEKSKAGGGDKGGGKGKTGGDLDEDEDGAAGASGVDDKKAGGGKTKGGHEKRVKGRAKGHSTEARGFDDSDDEDEDIVGGGSKAGGGAAAGGKSKKYKKEELEAAGTGTGTDGKKYKAEELAGGKGRKYKTEERAAGIAGAAAPPASSSSSRVHATDAMEEGGAKQRKTNKKLKDYEIEGGAAAGAGGSPGGGGGGAGGKKNA